MWIHSQDPTYVARFLVGHFRRLRELGSAFTEEVFVSAALCEHCDAICEPELGFVGRKRLLLYVFMHKTLELPQRFSFYDVRVLVDMLNGEDGSKRLLVMTEGEGPEEPDYGIPF